MKTIINWLFGKKEKPEYVKPVLGIHHSIIPQSYLNKILHWDSHLYTNQTILNDE